MEKVFNWRKSEVAYTIFGEGKTPMIAFHGYGQDKSVFKVLEEGLGDTYTMYAIDLPFHGNTQWAEPYDLNYDDLEELTQSFLRNAGIEGMVSLIGYSIGGNYVLGLAQKCPHFVDEIWLIASDGLEPKPGFNFITKTILGRLMFIGFTYIPHPVFYILKGMKRMNVIPERVFTFFMKNIDTRLKRKLLYLRWRSVSRIRSNVRKVKKQLALYNIPVNLIFGNNDGVIPVRYAKRFAAKVPSAHLVVTEQGHQMLEKATNQYIRDILKGEH